MFYLLSLLIAEFVLLCCLVYHEEKWWGVTTLIITFVLYNLLFDQKAYINWWHWIYHNPATLIEYIVVWLVLGVIWSFFKWYVFLKKKRKESLGLLKGKDIIIPSVSQYSNKIITWMVYWPLSMTLYVATHPVQKLYTFIFERVSGVYAKIVNSVYKQEISIQNKDDKSA